MSTKLISQDEVQVRKEYLEVQLEILHKILKEKLEEHEKLQKLETKLGKNKDSSNDKKPKNENRLPETINPKTNRNESNQKASEKKKPKGSHAEEMKHPPLPLAASQHRKKNVDPLKDRENFSNLLVQKLQKVADKDKTNVKDKRKEKEKEKQREQDRERERERAKNKNKNKTLVLHSKAGASNYKMLVSDKVLNEESSERMHTSDHDFIPQYRNREKTNRRSKAERDYAKDMKPKKRDHKVKRENDALTNMLSKEPSRHQTFNKYEKGSKREVKESVHRYEEPKHTIEKELNRNAGITKEGFDTSIDLVQWQKHIDDLKENKKRLERTLKEHKNDPNFTYLSNVIKGFTKNIRERTKELKKFKSNETKIE